jgi:hypothetical protein
MPDLLVAAIAGLALGLIAAALGYAELRHRDRLAGHEQSIGRHPALGDFTRPNRHRW